MSRRVVPLTGDVWDLVTAPCRSCLFWVSGERPRTAATGAEADEALVRKEAWTTALVHQGRAPGRAIEVDGVMAGFIEFVPADRVAPRRPPVPAVDPDALVITSMWVEPGYRTRGLGRLLVQQAVKEAVAEHHPAVEALADRRWRPEECVLPITWLLHEGFVVAREHPRYPLLRLEVSRTVRWAESWEHAVEEVRDLLPRRAPRPVTEAVSESVGS